MSLINGVFFSLLVFPLCTLYILVIYAPLLSSPYTLESLMAVTVLLILALLK